MTPTIRRFTTAATILALCALPAAAKVDKKTCKAHARSVETISDELGVSTDQLADSGRSLLGQVQAWLGEHDNDAVEVMADRLQAALDGVKECESNGFFAQVTRVKPQARTLKSAVLPWLRNVAALDPCQETITTAIEQRETDPDGAIAALEGAVGDCRDETWTREARRQLAEAHFVRGDLSRSDYAAGREQVRLTLESATAMEPEQETTVKAILARLTIEAGKALMDAGSFAEAAAHWSSYIEFFGTPSFEPMYASRQVAEGAYELRSLRDASFQWALACLEQGDAACVTARVEAAEGSGEMADVAEALVGRAFARAGDGNGSYERLALGLLDRWRKIEPGSYQIKRMLQNEVLDRPAEARQALLRSTEHCWIPTEIATMLQEEGRDFVAEARLAAACTGGGGEASAMLAEVEVDRASSLLDQVVLADSAAKKQRLERELETMLARLGDSVEVREIREGLEAERARQRARAANVVDNSREIYADCTTILATIQWNESREEDYATEMRNFRTGCCAYLRNNRAGWVRHLKSKLDEEQVVIKQRLFERYCNR